jgi:hypothetical protein
MATTTLPAACRPIQLKITELKADRAALQADLREASTPQKAGLAAAINALNRQIADKNLELNACKIKNGVPVPLNAGFTGRVTLTTTDGRARGPFSRDVSGRLLFSADRRNVHLLGSLPPLSHAIDTPLGKNTTTVTAVSNGEGSYDPASGRMSVPVQLFFDQSIDVPFRTEDSRLFLTLSTGTPGGRPVDASGNFTVAGTGIFQDGELDDERGTITLSGRLDRHP